MLSPRLDGLPVSTLSKLNSGPPVADGCDVVAGAEGVGAGRDVLGVGLAAVGGRVVVGAVDNRV